MTSTKRNGSPFKWTDGVFGLAKAKGKAISHVVHHSGASEGDTLIASYNIHKGVGLDRRFDPARIISVLREIDADVVALQEATRRFGERICLLDLKMLERECGLLAVPPLRPGQNHGWHGNIILFREGSVEEMRQIDLPGIEPRGALIIDLTLPAGPLRIIAAHLGLLRHSRARQVETLLAEAEAEDGRPTLLMGDLNEWRLGRRSSLQKLAPSFGPLHASVPSFPASFPVLALDRVLAKPHDLITGLELHDTPLARIASDHLPIKANIQLADTAKSDGADLAAA
ncbi:endonuclease/exonuclease/phosphatase family protein [Aquamicrobium zhengzhouense]|uniref:Endonuclease/exonuclease/phosphatase family protein n=1 Tax=Aquamicrobium zhengzhouense TaxID=2781738 RepID=A0ABS0SFK3_9HYPH|nr:endonuclease/exonuclease/phosphatase family protein [Aquamicrobium zhengzhouense]MBI1622041.1 endonuclease/exonuclease/phosphatase family protein [Aquamicrobium zhengzhouense]